MKRRWLLVSSRSDPSQGGIGAYVHAVSAALRSCGWQVELMTRAGQRGPAGVVVHPVHSIDADEAFGRRVPHLRAMEVVRPYRYAIWSLAVERALWGLVDAPDVVECVDVQAEGLAALASARLRARWSTTKWLLYAHTPMWVEEQLAGADPMRFGRGVYHAWERRSLRLADGVLGGSRQLLSQLEIEGQRALVAAPPFVASQSTAEPLDRDSESPTVLYIGTFNARKGLDAWLASLNGVLEDHGVRVHIIGNDTPTGPADTSFKAWALSRLDPSLHPRIQWSESLSHADVQACLAAASLVVVPSRFESFSMVAAEAVAMGVPVVVGQNVGIREHVPSIPYASIEDVAALASMQRTILRDRDRAMRIAAQCRAELLSACDPRSLIAERESFCEQLWRLSSNQRWRGDNSVAELEHFVRDVERRERDGHGRLGVLADQAAFSSSRS